MPIPFERLTTAETARRDWRSRAEAVLAGNWGWKGRPVADVRPPLDWRTACAEERSWQLALQSWEPLAPVLATLDRDGDPALLGFAVAFAADWAAACGDRGTDVPLAWYDSAVGMRAYRLAYLLDMATRADAGDDRLQPLATALATHLEALADDRRFAAHSNHGIFQVAGQLAVARRCPDVPGAPEAHEQAIGRLHTIVEGHFTEEGMHREHSPHYHRMVSGLLATMISSDLASDEWFVAVQRRVQDALAWLVLPDRHLAMLGDTDRKSVASPDLDGIVSDAYRFTVSGGAEGAPPSEPVAVFERSGYAALRDRWPVGESDFADCAFLLHACAFHSRVHKHADDQTVLWYDRGGDVLVDAGRYGYVGRTERGSELARQGFWYADPHRMYVESTRAHNTVEIDGRSYDRTLPPYGSGIVAAGADGELRHSRGRVVHGDVVHERALVWLPGEWLLVLDALAGDPHEHVQWFHLAPEFERRDGLVFERPGARLAAVSLGGAQAVEPVRGAREPELQGWSSRKDGALEPLWALGFRAAGAAASFATLLRFTEDDVEPLRAEVGPGPAADVAWLEAGRETRVAVSPSGVTLTR